MSESCPCLNIYHDISHSYDIFYFLLHGMSGAPWRLVHHGAPTRSHVNWSKLFRSSANVGGADRHISAMVQFFQLSQMLTLAWKKPARESTLAVYTVKFAHTKEESKADELSRASLLFIIYSPAQHTVVNTSYRVNIYSQHSLILPAKLFSSLP